MYVSILFMKNNKNKKYNNIIAVLGGVRLVRPLLVITNRRRRWSRRSLTEGTKTSIKS